MANFNKVILVGDIVRWILSCAYQNPQGIGDRKFSLAINTSWTLFHEGGEKKEK